MRIYPISLSYQALVSGRLSHPAANPLRLTLRMRDGESLAAPCVLRAELHTSRFIAANTTPLAVATAAASPFQGEWNLDFTSAQMNQPTPPEGVRKLWLVVYATEGSTILYTFAGIDVDLGWHAISQATPPPPFVPLVADVGGRGWQTGWQYEAETLVVNGTTPYVSISAHTSSAATEPGVGANWQTVWQAAGGVASVDWGDIGGSLSSQVDLMEALDAKQDTAALGTMSSQNANNVFITGGSISGLSSLNAGTVTASTSATVTASTASTSTTTGALVVTGGVGIGGAINTGADCVINGLRLGRGVGNSTTNVAFGLNAGNSILTGTPSSQEVAIGNVALATAHSGSGNCAVGSNSMQFLSGSSSASNTAIGTSSLFNIATSSNDNVAAGSNAGRYAGTGTAGTNTLCSTSVFIGTASRPAASGQTNQVVIGGLNAIGDGSNTTVIGTASTTQSRIFGGNALTTGANGQSTQLGQSTTLITPLSGATQTAAALIPANSIVIGVTARVTTAITGATSFDIGDGTTANIFGDDVAVAFNTTSQNTIAPTRYATATNVVLTANGGNFTAGAVRLTVHFLTLVAPTS